MTDAQQLQPSSIGHKDSHNAGVGGGDVSSQPTRSQPVSIPGAWQPMPAAPPALFVACSAPSLSTAACTGNNKNNQHATINNITGIPTPNNRALVVGDHSCGHSGVDGGSGSVGMRGSGSIHAASRVTSADSNVDWDVLARVGDYQYSTLDCLGRGAFRYA